LLWASIFLTVFLLSGCARKNSAPIAPADKDKLVSAELTVYAYDSLTAEWGLIPAFLSDFEKTSGLKVKMVKFTDTGAMLSQLILEKDQPKADVVMGLDNLNYAQIANKNILEPYRPVLADKISSDLWFDKNFTLTPFDYGYIGFVYDSRKIKFAGPISLKDLVDSKYKDKIIIEQAGLSSPGTQLLVWSKSALSAVDYDKFWLGMKDNVLTVAPDWSTAYYSLFLQGEAPIVLSYLTSPAYHIDQEKANNYQAVPIKEGYFRQVEGVAVIKGATNSNGAKKFIDYVLSQSVQDKIATTQWMWPVMPSSSLPVAFGQIITPTSSQILYMDSAILSANLDQWLKKYNSVFGL